MATKRQIAHETQKGLDIAAALGAVTKEKNINIDLVLDSLRDAIAMAARKYIDKDINVEVDVDREKGVIKAYTLQRVVLDQVTDPASELILDDAQDIDPTLEVGDEIVEELDVNVFGRSAIQTAKQIIIQRVREHEREKIFADFSDRIGELVTGTVQQIEKGNLLINLGRTEAISPFREQIRKERYRQGDPIRACILDVRNNVKGPQVILSRACPEFVERLFEIEVPEIFERIVRVIKVVRAPGYRAKVAVTTSDSRIDPVGACVGMRGNRVQAIVRELSNERMDIVHWTEDQNLLIRRILAPAEVRKMIPVGDAKIVVIISDEDLAIAIGREGQNVRLSSKLAGIELDIYGEEEFSEFTDEQQEEILTAPPPPEEEPETDDAEDDEDDLGVEGEAAPETELADIVENAVGQDADEELSPKE